MWAENGGGGRRGLVGWPKGPRGLTKIFESNVSENCDDSICRDLEGRFEESDGRRVLEEEIEKIVGMIVKTIANWERITAGYLLTAVLVTMTATTMKLSPQPSHYCTTTEYVSVVGHT